jgi:cytochrome c1
MMWLSMAALAGCKPVPDGRDQIDPNAVERGRQAIERVQCGACHQIPGISWPQGRLGPSLDRIGQQGVVAGTLPNNQANLAAFIRNAPAVRPGTLMPAMPVSEAEARDIADYLTAKGQQ